MGNEDLYTLTRLCLCVSEYVNAYMSEYFCVPCTHTRARSLTHISLSLYFFISLLTHSERFSNPTYPTSLHYNNPYEPNEYVSAILGVCDVLAAYDSDGLFPVYTRQSPDSTVIA